MVGGHAWSESLLALDYQSALSYQAGGGPVAQVHIDDSDDVMIYVSYTILLNALDSLSTVAMALQAVDGPLQAIARPVEDLADQVNRLIAKSELELTSGVHASQEDLLREISAAPTPQARGKALETLLAFALNRVPGLKVHTTNYRTETEEIDLIVLNASEQVPLSREGSLILVECKNWTDRVPRSELSSLETKIRNRGGRCTVGYLVSWNGVTEDLQKERLRMSRGGHVVPVLTAEELTRALRQGTFPELLQESLLEALQR